MKIAYRFIVVLSVLGQMGIKAQPTPIDPLSLYNNVVKEYNSFTTNKLELAYASLQGEGEDQLNPLVQKISDSLAQSIRRLEAYDVPTESLGFKSKTLESFYLFQEVFMNDFPKLLPMREQRFESLKKLAKYFEAEEEVDQKIFADEQAFLQVQSQYASQYNLNPQGSPDRSIEQGKALARVDSYKRYSRDIYLQYFEIAKLNTDFWNYYDEQDLIHADLKRQEILLRSKRVMNRIKKLPDFEGESGYKDAVVAVLETYYAHSKKEYKYLIYIQDKIENPSEVESPEEAKIYNQLVDRHNQIISDYTTNVTQLVEEMERQQKLLVARVIPTQEVEIHLTGNKEEVNYPSRNK